MQRPNNHPRQPIEYFASFTGDFCGVGDTLLSHISPDTLAEMTFPAILQLALTTKKYGEPLMITDTDIDALALAQRIDSAHYHRAIGSKIQLKREVPALGAVTLWRTMLNESYLAMPQGPDGTRAMGGAHLFIDNRIDIGYRFYDNGNARLHGSLRHIDNTTCETWGYSALDCLLDFRDAVAMSIIGAQAGPKQVQALGAIMTDLAAGS